MVEKVVLSNMIFQARAMGIKIHCYVGGLLFTLVLRGIALAFSLFSLNLCYTLINRL